MKYELLRATVSRSAAPEKTAVAIEVVGGGWLVSAGADAVRTSSRHISARQWRDEQGRDGLPLPDTESGANVHRLIAIFRLTAIGGSMRCFAATLKETGARPPIPSAPIAS